MKLFVASTWACFVISCGSTNSSVNTEATEVKETEAKPELLTGMVTNAYSDEGCPWLVQITTRGKEDFLIPIALDTAYLHHKMRLQFSYRTSRASSGNCSKGSPAILEDITQM